MREFKAKPGRRYKEREDEIEGKKEKLGLQEVDYRMAGGEVKQSKKELERAEKEDIQYWVLSCYNVMRAKAGDPSLF